MAGRQMRRDMGEIIGLAGGVHHQEDMAVEPRRHQVVADAAVIGGELGIAHPAEAEAGDVARHQGFERRRGIRPGDPCLAHMRDVEQPRMGAGMQMLALDAHGILDRHQIAGKGHHLAALRQMQIVKRGLQKIGGGTALGRLVRTGHRVAPRKQDCGRASPRSGAAGRSDVPSPEMAPLCLRT